MNGLRPKLFVLGSCVSRDIWSVNGTSEALELAGYIARTSLGSAFGTIPAPRGIAAKARLIESGFQRRMVIADLDKQASNILQTTPFDYVLLDFIDERFDLTRFPGWPPEAVYTLSAEFRRLGRVPGATLIRSGSQAHLDAWHRGLSVLVETVGRERLILNRAFWATHTTDGELLGDEWAVTPHNAYLQKLYGLAEASGLKHFVDYPPKVRADPAHRWGLAPFHYEASLYQHVRTQIMHIVTTDRIESVE